MKRRRQALYEAISDVCESPDFGCEIGVWKGELSDWLLRNFPGLHITLVDCWSRDCLPYSYRKFAHHCTGEESEFEAVYQSVVERFESHSSRCRILRHRSLSAAELIDSETMDFVFLDASHDFSSVLMDCVAWWRNVRPGGILCGDDYASHNDRLGISCVHGAVDFFAARVGREVQAQDRIWRIVK